DAMLRRLADAGVVVSSHPDAILALGTKDVLVQTRALPFGSDVQRVDSLDQVRAEVLARLRQGPRVLKQQRGHSGIGIWRVELDHATGARWRLREARRGSDELSVDLDTLLQTLAPYFEPAQGGHMIDQAWQPGLAHGMVRAYLVGDRVGGFGHQALNAFCPPLPGQPAPQPGPRLYHGADAPAFQGLRRELESGWIEQLRACVGLAPERLPLLWDCDFIAADPAAAAAAHPVLCEINVSSVSPFPPSCIAPLVQAVIERLR
ncbi:MAG: Cj0069 family protein, partial [Rubrivivax sp.]|nr:Cj0069 family protein [Rubrivivax sp.]